MISSTPRSIPHDIKLLLLSTTFPNKFNALHIAACRSNIETCRDLLNANSELNLLGSLTKHGNCALHYAAQNDNIEMINYFLNEPGFDVNAVDGNGLGAIHISSQLGFLDALERLLKVKGIDLDASTNNGYTSK